MATQPPQPTYAALTALHTHYRALLQIERDTMARERHLWDDERALYLSRISELEATAAATATTTTTTAASPPHQAISSPQKEPPISTPLLSAAPPTPPLNPQPRSPFDDNEDEITPQEMAQLLREATRIVYPLTHARQRGQSLADPMAAAVAMRRREVQEEETSMGKEEVVELRLKKTSNFGSEFGRWR